MADVIRSFRYTTPGRGRGVLGLSDLQPCRRPGRCPEDSREEEKSGATSSSEGKTKGGGGGGGGKPTILKVGVVS